MTADSDLLERLEAYYDAAPRAQSRVEEIGPFTLFVAESGWPYYARPRLWSRQARPPQEGARPPQEGTRPPQEGARPPQEGTRPPQEGARPPQEGARPPQEGARPPQEGARPPQEGARPPQEGARPPAPVTVDDVQAVLARQRQLDVPQALEWVDETTPGLVDVVQSAGAQVEKCPLLVLDGDPRGDAGTVRMVKADEREVTAATQAAVEVSFQSGGTARGEAGIDARDEQIRSAAATVSSTIRDRLATGTLRLATVLAPESPDAGPVGGGSCIPVDGVAEIVGVGVLPAYRRRGLAGHLTYVLATDALERGVNTVFCSAQSADVARVYQAVGFRRVGTACIASMPTT